MTFEELSEQHVYIPWNPCGVYRCYCILSQQPIIDRNKRTTHVHRLSNDIAIVLVPVHFDNYISSPTCIHYTSDSEFEVAKFWIGFGKSLAF